MTRKCCQVTTQVTLGPGCPRISHDETFVGHVARLVRGAGAAFQGDRGGAIQRGTRRRDTALPAAPAAAGSMVATYRIDTRWATVNAFDPGRASAPRMAWRCRTCCLRANRNS